ncbi:hypothetical protein I3842_09G089300 [Carya illinoinensis]|uniref:Uncharacterized protein n=1 Tax=Carya illinoinensis TaxID=32201 RepID=A0A922J7W6_CARIL|nr:hypothetical protein I3842_09G089300 [Carya illinoinensis]
MGEVDDHTSITTHDNNKEAKSLDSPELEFSKDEVVLITRMFRLVGERLSLIAGRIPRRTAEEIEKYCTSRHT